MNVMHRIGRRPVISCLPEPLKIGIFTPVRAVSLTRSLVLLWMTNRVIGHHRLLFLRSESLVFLAQLKG